MRKKKEQNAPQTRKPPMEANKALFINAFTPDMIELPDCVATDDYHTKEMIFNSYPSEVGLDWLNDVFNYPNLATTILLEPLSATELKDKIDKHDSHVSDSLLSTRNTVSKVDDLERQRKHGHEMLSKIGDEGEKFFNFAIIAGLRADDYEDLKNNEAAFRTVIGNLGIKATFIQYGQLESYFAASPFRTRSREVFARGNRPIPASTLAWALPFKEIGLDDGVGIPLGHDGEGGKVRIDLPRRTETRHNSNVVILGGSGSGKSTLANALALREYLLYGTRIIAIDPEAEKIELARALGGDVITIGAQSSNKLSPFQPRAITFSKDDDEDDERDEAEDATLQLVLASSLPFTMSFLQQAFKISDEDMKLLEIALEETYARYGITTQTTFKDYFDQELDYPIMNDLYETLLELKERDEEHRACYDRIALQIRPAAIGIYAPLWNTRTALKTDSNFIVINTEEMDGMSDSMKQAQYYNLLSWVWSEIRLNRFRDTSIRVIIDEAHNLINRNSLAAADLVKSMVKRIRKRNGGTTIITQEVEDFLAREVKSQGAAIVNNATYKFFGQSEGENIKAIKELYAMPTQVIEKIKKAPKGEFAFFAGTSDKTWLKVDIEEWEWPLFGTAGGK